MCSALQVYTEEPMLSLDVWTSEQLLRLQRERPDPLGPHRAELARLRAAYRPAWQRGLALNAAGVLVALGERLRAWAAGRPAVSDARPPVSAALRQHPAAGRTMAAIGSVWVRRS